MKLSISGAYNVRDLGGMKTSLGTIKPNRLIRSGELSRLTPEGAQQLLQIPLERVVDLRTDAEMANSPDVEMPVIREHVPIISATTFGITYEKSSGPEIAVMLQAGFERMKQRGETYSQHLEIMYRNFVRNEFSRLGYGKFLKLLAHHPVDGATLWHCTAGKDRCGTCAVLLLYCLGASKEQIYEDYLLTNEQSAERTNYILNKSRGHVPDSALAMIKHMLSAESSFLDGFFEEIATLYQNVDNFLAECGVTDEDVALLRKNYLE